MKKTTTTMREYDENGNMTKETVTEVTEDYTIPATRVCTCGLNYYTTYCPVHGYTRPYTWTSGGTFTPVPAKGTYQLYNGSTTDNKITVSN